MSLSTFNHIFGHALFYEGKIFKSMTICLIHGIEDILGHQVLWLKLPSPHHGTHFDIDFVELFGDNSGPGETFFKFMKLSWASLDLADIQL